MKKSFFKTRLAAIILIAAGYGWAGGLYIPVNSSVLAYLFQFVIIIALLIMGIRSVSMSGNEKHKSNWPVTGLSIFAVLLLLISVLDIIHWSHNVNANFFGAHNNFAELVPAALLITGNVLLIISIVRSMGHDAKAEYLFKSQYNIL